MGLLDFILNAAGLLLWLNWRAIGANRPAETALVSLAGTLRRAEPRHTNRDRWLHLGGLLLLLFVRSLVYRQIGSKVNWIPRLNLGVITLPFNSGVPGARMLLFSLLSFLTVLAGFYFWLLLISALNRKVTDPDPVQQWVRLHLGLLERLPAVLKLLLPPVVTCLTWLALAPLFARLGLIPPLQNGTHALQQGVVIGLGTWLTWKWLLVGVLALHLVNSYVYFGQSPFWNFIAVTGGNLLTPLRWLPLRVARIDLAPIVAIILVTLLAACALNGLEFNLHGSIRRLPGLTELFNRLPF